MRDHPAAGGGGLLLLPVEGGAEDPHGLTEGVVIGLGLQERLRRHVEHAELLGIDVLDTELVEAAVRGHPDPLGSPGVNVVVLAFDVGGLRAAQELEDLVASQADEDRVGCEVGEQILSQLVGSISSPMCLPTATARSVSRMGWAGPSSLWVALRI